MSSAPRMLRTRVSSICERCLRAVCLLSVETLFVALAVRRMIIGGESAPGVCNIADLYMKD